MQRNFALFHITPTALADWTVAISTGNSVAGATATACKLSQGRMIESDAKAKENKENSYRNYSLSSPFDDEA